MPIKVVDPDTGVETDAFTAEEVAAQTKTIQDAADVKIKDNETHMKEKLDEFQKGKTATQLEQETAETARKASVEAAQKTATEALEFAKGAEQKRLNTIKDSVRQNYVGKDPELTKKFEEAWEIVNFPITKDEDIASKANMVANMIGVNAGMGMDFTFGGGGHQAPNFQRREGVNETTHKTFRSALPGMDDFLKPNAEEK